MNGHRSARAALWFLSALAALLVSVTPSVARAVPPTNDQCAGAEVIPPAGPFPLLTSITADITDATTTGDPPTPSCQTNVSRSIWYSFTPARTGQYSISSCADAPTGSTVDDLVVAVYTSSNNTCGGTFTQLAGACDDDGCTTESLQSVIGGTTLTAGTTYFIVAYKFGTVAPTVGNTAVQLRLNAVFPPSNDNCSAAIALALNVPTFGDLEGATNDIQVSTAAPNCYALPATPAPIGQSTSTAAGRDVAYQFTAPSAGSYAFRAQVVSGSSNLVLSVGQSCPAGAGPTTITDCLGASNRNSNSSAGSAAEETGCIAMTAGQNVFIHVDETTAATTSARFRVEAIPCERETEPNDLPATANRLTCGLVGSISPVGEADFFALGNGAGQRVYTMIDGVSGSSADFDLRITTALDTLEYDDNDNDALWGGESPNIAGRALTLPSFLRVSHFTVSTQSEPYRIYSVLQDDTALGAETEPNDTVANANISSTMYFRGTTSASTDVDLYQFCAQAGDVIMVNVDGDPLRDLTPINAAVSLLDQSAAVLVSANDSRSTSSNTMTAGSLTATAPNSPGEALVWHALTSGVYYARVSASAAGDYVTSVSLNCASGSSQTADLGVAITPMPATFSVGSMSSYQVRVSNAGPRIATNVALTFTPSGLALSPSITPPSGWTCSLAAGVFTCRTPCLAPGNVDLTFTMTFGGCGGGLVAASAAITALTTDPNAINNTAASSVMLSVASCDDGDACTTDSCNIMTGCVNTPITCTASDQCHIAGTCNPATGVCSNPNATDGTSCNDSNACTQTDSCQAGVCAGASPVICVASDQCHAVGVCNPATGVCSNPNATDGTTCTDGDACTRTDTCVAGVCAGASPVVCAPTDSCHLAGVCNAATGACSNPTAPDGTTCTDGNACTRTDTCVAGTCNGADPVVCTALDACHVAGSCDVATGLCSNPNATDGTTCSDNNLCTSMDSCAAGVCTPGSMVTCDDGNVCTAEACTPLGGCASTPIAGCCRMNSECDDGDACTIESCDLATNRCIRMPRSCDDGNLCTLDECVAGACRNTTILACVDAGADADAGDASDASDGSANDAADDANGADAGDASSDDASTDAGADSASEAGSDGATDDAASDASDASASDSADDASAGDGASDASADATSDGNVDDVANDGADAADVPTNDVATDGASMDVASDVRGEAGADASMDGATDGSRGGLSGDGACGCRVPGAPDPSGGSPLRVIGLAIVVLAVVRRRRRAA